MWLKTHLAEFCATSDSKWMRQFESDDVTTWFKTPGCFNMCFLVLDNK